MALAAARESGTDEPVLKEAKEANPPTSPFATTTFGTYTLREQQLLLLLKDARRWVN
jgi:hypothetical protein